MRCEPTEWPGNSSLSKLPKPSSTQPGVNEPSPFAAGKLQREQAFRLAAQQQVKDLEERLRVNATKQFAAAIG